MTKNYSIVIAILVAYYLVQLLLPLADSVTRSATDSSHPLHDNGLQTQTPTTGRTTTTTTTDGSSVRSIPISQKQSSTTTTTTATTININSNNINKLDGDWIHLRSSGGTWKVSNNGLTIRYDMKDSNEDIDKVCSSTSSTTNYIRRSSSTSSIITKPLTSTTTTTATTTSSTNTSSINATSPTIKEHIDWSTIEFAVPTDSDLSIIVNGLVGHPTRWESSSTSNSSSAASSSSSTLRNDVLNVYVDGRWTYQASATSTGTGIVQCTMGPFQIKKGIPGNGKELKRGTRSISVEIITNDASFHRGGYYEIDFIATPRVSIA